MTCLATIWKTVVNPSTDAWKIIPSIRHRNIISNQNTYNGVLLLNCIFQDFRPSFVGPSYLQVEGEGGSLVCETCGKNLHSHSSYRKHMRFHMGLYPYRCRECGRGFSVRWDLEDHMRHHTGERLTCGCCQRKFVSRRGYQGHAKLCKKDQNWHVWNITGTVVAMNDLPGYITHALKCNYICDSGTCLCDKLFEMLIIINIIHKVTQFGFCSLFHAFRGGIGTCTFVCMFKILAPKHSGP